MTTVDMPRPQIAERTAKSTNGWPVLGIGLVVAIAAATGAIFGFTQQTNVDVAFGVLAAIVGVLALSALAGLTLVAPNEARVLQLLGGSYTGSLRTDGLRWVNPLTMRRKVSTRIRNHETGLAKVNDVDGNPIEISAVVVWQVQDTARACFEVDDFVEFVAFQTEAAVRHIAGAYPYDAADRLSLRENADEITAQLSKEIDARVASAGVRIIESRITRLAYAPEIAQAMLRRQQAGAVVAARHQIVQGAVGMVQLALGQLEASNVVDLDEERKAAMVSNLLVVLCADRDAQPVVNTGTLYQ
jgi:regulator of protease activity HflC (stomatin/prohibitin superfamily)